MSDDKPKKTRSTDPSRLQRRKVVLRLPVKVSESIAAAVEDAYDGSGSALLFFTDMMQDVVDDKLQELDDRGSDLLVHRTLKADHARLAELEKEREELLARLGKTPDPEADESTGEEVLRAASAPGMIPDDGFWKGRG